MTFQSPRSAAATLSRELSQEWAGTWPQSLGIGSSTVTEMFLGAASTGPLLGETLLQRGRMGQSRNPSEVRGQEKQLHLRQNSGGRCCLGLGHRLCKSGEWKEAEDKGQVRDC